MKLSVMLLPGNGEKTVEVSGRNTCTMNDVIAAAHSVFHEDISSGRTIAVNGANCSRDQFGIQTIYPMDVITATREVKGAKKYYRLR